MFREWTRSMWSLFSLDEIRTNRTVQTLWWILLAYQVLLFTLFLGDDAATTNAFVSNQYTCWPWLPQCGEWYFLSLKPVMSQSLWYAALFVLQCGAFLAALKERWRLAMGLFATLLAWEAVLVFLLSYEAGEAYIYMHLLLGGIVLFLPKKRYALQLCVIGVHALGACMEWYRYWYLAGGSSFQLPLLSASQSLWLISSVFVVQTAGILYLLSHDVRYRRAILGVLIALHAYGAISFDENFFILIAPVLLVLFWDYEPAPSLTRREKSLCAALAGALLLVHLWIFFASSSLNFTFARPHLGVATYFPQTSGISEAVITRADGSKEDLRSTWTDRPCRCSPYSRWFELKKMCEYNTSITSISWTLDVSLQKGKWSRIIDVENVCDLKFNSIFGTSWIHVR